ncbi:MAG: branched-chain amino acid ABC transporter permease, partial [Pseudomonadota bacterium]
RAEDGVSFKLPGIFEAAWSGGRFLGLEINGRLMTYYFILIVAVILFIGMLRFVNSPVGRVLKAARDNTPRATALGYKTFRYQILSIVFSSCLASMAGILYAMWLSYVAPETVFSIQMVMLPILLMVIIGGLGTLYGSIIGTAFIKITETWLPDLQQVTKALFPDAVIVQRLAERWVLYFGILFILVVFFFPRGFVGTTRDLLARRKAKALTQRSKEP